MSCPPLLVLQVLLPLVTVPVGKGLTPSFGLMVLTGDERGSGGTATSVLGARLFLRILIHCTDHFSCKFASTRRRVGILWTEKLHVGSRARGSRAVALCALFTHPTQHERGIGGGEEEANGCAHACARMLPISAWLLSQLLILFPCLSCTVTILLPALEEKIPWQAVKKIWGVRRTEWVTAVVGAFACAGLAQQLIVLESMLKTDTLSPTWPNAKTSWKNRMSSCHEPSELSAALNELDKAIQWQRILVAPDGRPLTAAEIASGQFGVGGTPSVPVPPPLSVAAPPNPPEGVPRAAARMLVLLQSMGARQFDPKVVVQLLDVMHSWTATILMDASNYARIRVLGTSGPQLASQPEPPVETQDVALAVRSRVEHSFTRIAAREVLAQQAADTNSEPMPILPRRTGVLLPSDMSECVPSARRLLERGLDVDDDDELDGLGVDSEPPHSWWQDRVDRSLMPTGIKEEGMGGEPLLQGPPKRQKH